jgi:tetratricopeptide (TPR) repeat protein
MMRSDFVQIMSSICNVDAANAQAFHEADRDRIREAIESTVGMARINEAALDPLRQWLLDTATEAISEKSDPELYRGLGLLRFDLGKLDSAKDALQESARLRRERLEEQPQNRQLSISLAGDLANLAACVLEEGDAERSLELSEAALMLKRTQNDQDVALILSNKGLALKSMKRHDQALACFESALQLGQGTLMRADLKENLETNKAETLREMGEPKAASVILRRVLESRTKSTGRNHVATAQTLNLLGQSLLDAGELDEAESMFQEALTIRQRALGKSHPRVGLCVANLAKVDMKRGKQKEARERLEELLEIQTQAFGPTHQFVQDTEELLSNLAEQKQPRPRPFSERAIQSNIPLTFAYPGGQDVGDAPQHDIAHYPPRQRPIFSQMPQTFEYPAAEEGVAGSQDYPPRNQHVVFSQMPQTFEYPAEPKRDQVSRHMSRELSVSMMFPPTADDFDDDDSAAEQFPTPDQNITLSNGTRTEDAFQKLTSERPKSSDAVPNRNRCIIM